MFLPLRCQNNLSANSSSTKQVVILKKMTQIYILEGLVTDQVAAKLGFWLNVLLFINCILYEKHNSTEKCMCFVHML